nr:MAG TPA: hypothetical protein [Bacteriophage sp.]
MHRSCSARADGTRPSGPLGPSSYGGSWLDGTTGRLESFDVLGPDTVVLPRLDCGQFLLSDPVPNCNQLHAVAVGHFLTGITAFHGQNSFR